MTFLRRTLASSTDNTSLYNCTLSSDCAPDDTDAYTFGYCLRCVYLSPPPPPPPPPAAKNHFLPYLISAICALGFAFLILTTCTIILRYGLSRRRRSTSTSRETVFVDAPVIDHPVWHIVTIGLPKSVIDSIATFKYKMGGDGVIDCTDCSVCLTEFEDGDDLRLLPKCSHAFHLPCIDTWLSSHQNCPLCRAPVTVTVAVEGLDSSERGEEAGNTSTRADDFPIEGVRIAEILKRNRENRVLSDLGENCRIVNEDFHQQVRRSVSLDAPAASVIRKAVEFSVAVETGEGSCSKQVGRMEVDKAGDKKVRRDSSMSRLIKSSSIGFSLQKGPVSMKRSLSSSAKIFSSFRGSRGQSSAILPL